MSTVLPGVFDGLDPGPPRRSAFADHHEPGASSTKARSQRPVKDPEDTHHDLAQAWLIAQSVGDHLPIYANGAFYVPTAAGLWEQRATERVEVEIAQQFNGMTKLCRRAADYRGIASHAASIASDPEFFDSAPLGVVTPDGFHSIKAGGKVMLEPLALDHRQVFALQWAPRAFASPELFDRMLAAAFAGDHEADQTALMWELIGSILFGLLSSQQLAVLLYGKEKSGKSTFQRLIERLFPPAAVSAASPSCWGREYNVAAMAGKRLNVVGELADDSPIPAAAFKNVTGGNLIEGRHPTHRPFYFTCKAAHVFASNVLPASNDRTDAFFRRWRIVRFSNRIADDKADPELFDKIVAREMPAILARAFKGAEAVASTGRVRTTAAHDALIAKWKAAANPVLQFLLDDEWVELGAAEPGCTTREAFDAYRRWASSTGFRNPFGRNHFLDLLDSTGAGLGVVVKKAETRSVVRGLRLIQAD